MNVRSLSESVRVIDIAGDLATSREDEVMQAYDAASRSGVRAIVLNFTELEYMNSGGIGLLVTLLIRANRRDQRLLVFGLNQHYREIFELTRLNEAIVVYGSEAEALQPAELLH